MELKERFSNNGIWYHYLDDVEWMLISNPLNKTVKEKYNEWNINWVIISGN